ncbi:MAG TPA: hypothetical protein VNK48_03970 [Xanthobacteraceae bacterium]|nr:hypothetical protein [Xanthobacteraceae bacterium]
MAKKLNPDLAIYLTEIAPGSWLAATGNAPYFCVEGESRDEVQEIALRALRFFVDSVNTLVEQRTRGREPIPTFDRSEKITARELMVA